MTVLAGILESEGWILRTGDAKGADTAFSNGVIMDFNKVIFPKGSQTEKSTFLALSVHPNPEAAKKYLDYIGRDPLQLLGKYLDEPSKFVICWTPGGKTVGGTAVNILLAEKFDIPVFNLFIMTQKEILEKIEEL
jgi:hypothetical protein